MSGFRERMEDKKVPHTIARVVAMELDALYEKIVSETVSRDAMRADLSELRASLGDIRADIANANASTARDLAAMRSDIADSDKRLGQRVIVCCGIFVALLALPAVWTLMGAALAAWGWRL